MRRVVADVEADGLYPTCLWIVCTRDIDTGEKQRFRDKDSFNQFAKTVDQWVFHNGLGYDVPHLNRLWHSNIDPQKVLDTFVLSRLFNYGLPGGHSLEAWGTRFGFPKQGHEDWSQYSEEMATRCEGDVEITYRLYKKVEPFLNKPQWVNAIRLEHDMANLCQTMHENGFPFDIAKARALHADIQKHIHELEKTIHKDFPPRARAIREILPRGTSFGTINRADFRWVEDGDLSEFTIGAPFTRIKWEPFNPGSPSQVVERLNEAGWKPVERTKGHTEELKKPLKQRDPAKLAKYEVYGWSVSEKNLDTLPETAPEGARKLRDWLILANRRSTLEEWFTHYEWSESVYGRQSLHAKFWHIGAWTQRMSHSNPNLANIPRVKMRGKDILFGIEGQYAADFRSLFTAAEGYKLVGVDAEGIQLRILAHYMNDPDFIRGVTSGRKEDETDIHNMNRKALGVDICRSRDDAKTFIYAWLLGAGVGKVASILRCSNAEAKTAMDNFLEAYPGLKELKTKTIPRDAKRGGFFGLDGRFIQCDSEHLMLAGYLQGGETIVMKLANVLWFNRLRKEKVPFVQVNFVHDEWQTMVPDETGLPEYVAEVQMNSIVQAGEILKLNCPLAGSHAIGNNWCETH